MATTDSGSATTPEEGRDNSTSLTIELLPQLLRRIEAAAARHGAPVQAYVEEVLEQAASRIEGASARTNSAPTNHIDLDPFREIREDILKTTCGRLLDDSVEEIRRMREARTLYLESL